MINAPSLANCSCLTFGQDVKELIEGGVKYLHFDIMDGHYVSNLCMPINYIADIKKEYPSVIIEVHLMVTNPMDYIEKLKQAGTDYVSFHTDATSFVRRTLTTIQEAGMKAGVLLNPSQKIDSIEPYIHLLDYVTLMTVEPGFAGQKFLPEGLDRLSELSDLRKKHSTDFLISIDGGVSYEHMEQFIIRGADMLVTGIYVVFNQEDGIVSACKRFEKYCSEVESKLK